MSAIDTCPKLCIWRLDSTSTAHLAPEPPSSHHMAGAALLAHGQVSTWRALVCSPLPRTCHLFGCHSPTAWMHPCPVTPALDAPPGRLSGHSWPGRATWPLVRLPLARTRLYRKRGAQTCDSNGPLAQLRHVARPRTPCARQRLRISRQHPSFCPIHHTVVACLGQGRPNSGIGGTSGARVNRQGRVGRWAHGQGLSVRQESGAGHVAG